MHSCARTRRGAADQLLERVWDVLGQLREQREWAWEGVWDGNGGVQKVRWGVRERRVLEGVRDGNGGVGLALYGGVRRVRGLRHSWRHAAARQELRDFASPFREGVRDRRVRDRNSHSTVRDRSSRLCRAGWELSGWGSGRKRCLSVWDEPVQACADGGCGAHVVPRAAQRRGARHAEARCYYRPTHVRAHGAGCRCGHWGCGHRRGCDCGY
mmetsp:Transcript_42220/g.99094  ORF Transcript_42220/g.99094 Transcript_42220/m.99094 type:complete len:212 (+) Transcript_42220:2077-2712(+)